MERNITNLSVGLALVGILLLIAFIPIPAYAAEVWSDDFDDGNYDGWTVFEGAFSCATGYLIATESGVSDWAGIFHNSTVVSGTWSFDYYLVGATHFVVNLMTDRAETSGGYNLLIQMKTVAVEIAIFYFGFDIKASWSFPYGTESWTHIDVTIDESWNMQVFVNGTHRLSYTLFPTDKTMLYFGVSTENGIGNAVDNIVVSDTIDIECTNATCELDHFETTTTTEDTTTTTTSDTTTSDTTPTAGDALPLELIVLGGGIAVVVIVLVIFLKRKG